MPVSYLANLKLAELGKRFEIALKSSGYADRRSSKCQSKISLGREVNAWLVYA